MPLRTRVRPGAGRSVIGLVAGLIFVVIGLVVVIPAAGLFGILWTAVAALITVINAYNLLSGGGLPLYEADIDEVPAAREQGADVETRLRTLTRLRDEGLISETEFADKRAELLRERW